MDDIRMDMGAMAAAVASRWLRIALVTAALLAATFAILMMIPKVYESSASILVEARQNVFTRATNETAQSRVPDDTAISSQIELIKSRETLLELIASEGLRDVAEFSGPDTSIAARLSRLLGRGGTAPINDEIILERVAKQIKVGRASDSRLISITFRSTDPDLAARAANAIAAIHVRRQGELGLSDTADATRWLENEIVKMRSRVAEAETKVATYRIENDLFVGDNNTGLLDQQLSDLTQQIVLAQERKNTARSRASVIRGLLKAGQPIDGAPDVRDSVIVQRLSESKGTLQGERAQKLATLLPNHPDIQALTAQIREIDKQIAAAGRQVADALEAEAMIQAETETALREELARLKISASDASRDSVELAELEREAKAQRDLLETYLLRYREAAARTDSNAALPDVRVVTTAAAATQAAYPRTGLTLASVGIVSVLLQIGQILFAELVSGRALIESRREEPVYDVPDSTTQVDREPLAPPATIVPKKPQNDVMQQDMLAMLRQDDPAENADDLDLASELIAINDEKTVLVVSLNGASAGGAVESISADLIARGRSVVEIDAGSRQPTAELGLSDLCAGKANFGDIVHRGQRSDFALVPWGQKSNISFNTERCDTLVKALRDVFQTVIVNAGGAGIGSSLPVFAGSDALVVLAIPGQTSIAETDRIRRDIEALGFEKFHVVKQRDGEHMVA